MKKKIVLLFLIYFLFIAIPVNAKEPSSNKGASTNKVASTVLNDNLQVQNIFDNSVDVNTDGKEISYKDISDTATIDNANEKITDTHWAYKAVMELSNKYNILVGMPDGKFDGDQATTRFELAQALVKTVNKMEEEHVQMTAMEQAGLKSLKDEFDKEIIALAARVEKNEVRVSELQDKHTKDITTLNGDISKLSERHYFSPELKFQYGFGDDATESPGNTANARVRLNSLTKVYDDTVAYIRLQAQTTNLINLSEVNGDIVDTDLTVAYLMTGDLTKWIPKKLGKIYFSGGLMPSFWNFYRDYTVAVDQRAFTDANSSFSAFNTQEAAFNREVPDGRRMSIGGEYIKDFSKLNAQIKATAARSTAGSLDLSSRIVNRATFIPNSTNFVVNDTPGSADEPSFYALSGKFDIPIKSQPIQLKVSHMYMFNNNGTDTRTYNIGGRLSTKFNGLGVFKFAVIGHNGTTAPRVIGGLGGHGMNYQFAFNPTIKAFGKFFGDPDKIKYDMKNSDAEDGKTEIGFGFANFHNDFDQGVNAFDIYVSRFFTKKIFGRILYTHINPSIPGMDNRDAVLFETNVRL